MSNIIGAPRPIDTGEYFKAEARIATQYSAPVGREIALRFPFLATIEIAHNKRLEADQNAARIKVENALRKLRIGLYLTDDLEEAMIQGEDVSNELWDELWLAQCGRVADSLLHYLRAGATLPPLFVKSITVKFGNQKYYQTL